MSKGKKILKITGRILLIILAVFILGTAVLFAIHRILLSKEKKFLEGEGYVSPISIGDRELNVYAYGSDSPKHNIVGIAGLGVHDYSFMLKPVTDRVSDENRIIVVDRSGYGLSDDGNEDRTVDVIVEEYRTALKNAGYEAPYVLLPHSIGGVYATYWECKYPEEIEGIIFFDGTPVSSSDDGDLDRFYNGFSDKLGVFAFKFGYQRLILKLLDESAFRFNTDENIKYSKAMTWKNAFSHSLFSETALMPRNCDTVLENMVTTDIPKVYIAASYIVDRESLIEYYNFMYNDMKKHGKKVKEPEYTDEFVEENLKVYKEAIDSMLTPYIEALGNCRLEPIIGDHYVYCYAPDKCGDILVEFLDELDKQ